MDKVIGDATPKKQNELQKRGINRKLEDEYNEDIVQSINTTVHEFRSEMTEDKRQHYNLLLQACLRTSKYKSAHLIASTLGFGDKMRKKMKRMKNQKMNVTRRQRKDTIDPLIVAKVEDHWRSEGISRIVPLKKKVKARKPLYVLETSYTAAYKKFKVSNPDLKIGYVSFIKHKPQNVRHLKAMERSVCCCQKCENIQLKMKTLNKTAKQHDHPDLMINDVDDLSDKTLCSYDKPLHPNKKCIDRRCSSCGTTKIQQSINSCNLSAAEYAQNYSSFEKAMTEKQLTIQDVPTDGNCFFWALSHQLDEHGSNGFTQQQLRRMLVST